MASSNMMERFSRDGNHEMAPARPLPSSYAWGQTVEIDSNAGIAWRRAVRVIRKHWKMTLAFAFILELLLALLVFSLANTYEARAVIDVEPPGTDTVGIGRDAAAAAAANAPAYLDTQTEILGSDGLILKVIDQLHLDQNPIFMKQTFFEKSVAWMAGWLPSNQKSAALGRDVDKLLLIFRRGLTVDQVKGSQLVEVRYESRDPKMSANIVNAMTDQYLRQTYRSGYDATLRAAASLSPQLDDLQKSVKNSANALLQFQKTHQGVELAGASNVGPDGTTLPTSAAADNPIANRVSQLNQQLTQAMADRLQQESYMKQIQSGKIDLLPQMKDNVLIQELTARLVDSRAQLAQALTVYGSNDPQARRLELQAEEINKQLDGERNRIAGQIQSAYASAQNREGLIRNTLNGMKGQLDQSNADVVQYDALKREADSNANLYTTLSSQIKEMAMTGSLTSSNIRVLDNALAPVKPDGPHRFRILGVGAFFGLIGGMVLAFAAENMNETITSTDDLRRWSGLPALALVPQISIPGSARALGPGRGARPMSSKSMSAIRTEGLKFLMDNPNSPEVEAIRNLETSIRVPGSADGKPQTILITSAFPGEGKTTVAINLAMALSRHGKTCLIDADFRNPAITRSFTLSLQPGLQDLLSNPANSLEHVYKPLREGSNLVVVGIGGRMSDPAAALTSSRMRDLVENLRKQFEYIVVDSPPIVPFSDARWLSSFADGTILVARCNTTTRRAVLLGLEILEELRAKTIGVVLNGVDLKSEYYSYGAADYAYRDRN